ncbi:MAG: aminotransferase class III-fold pyridoxal phosphate-dependent enzyme [Acidobacteriota bacterium]
MLAKGQGCRVYDADNVAYVDLLAGNGSNLLGYGNQYVMDAVRRASSLGLGSGFHITAEVELVELLGELVPGMAPWVVTSSELAAWELALRWCRRDTGRRLVVLFDGNRRGSVECFQVSASAPLGASQALVGGVADEVARLVRVAPSGNFDAFEALLGEVGVDTAAVVLDPIAAQFGVVPPDAEYLHRVQDLIRKVGARFVLDETITGFRLGRGGAAEAFALEPDVAVYGGALGGGISTVSAVAWASSRRVTVGDELPPPPQPVGVLSASATLSVLRNDAVHQRLDERGAQLHTGIESLAERFGRPLRINRIGSILAAYFSRQPVTDGNSFARVDQDAWSRFGRYSREAGLLLPSRSPVASFLTHAHGVKDVEQALAAMEQALRRMQKDDEV